MPRRLNAVVIACALALLPPPLLAQARPIKYLADEAQRSLILKQHCRPAFAVNEAMADRVFQANVSAMLDQHGEAKTTSAMDAALQAIFNDAKAQGLEQWCDYAAVLMNLSYPGFVGR